MDILSIILIILILLIYICAYILVNFYSKKNYENMFIKRFHNATYSIYENEATDVGLLDDEDYVFNQLNLNYEKLYQVFPNNQYMSILDVLQTLVNYYDCCSDSEIKKFFKIKKDLQFRDFMMNMCLYIKQKNPFLSIPPKEANLMQLIMNALDENNKSLGKSSLDQLSQEIEAKEKVMSKMDKTNRFTTIISIVGVILTIFFGIVSVIIGIASISQQ